MRSIHERAYAWAALVPFLFSASIVGMMPEEAYPGLAQLVVHNAEPIRGLLERMYEVIEEQANALDVVQGFGKDSFAKDAAFHLMQKLDEVYQRSDYTEHPPAEFKNLMVAVNNVLVDYFRDKNLFQDMVHAHAMRVMVHGIAHQLYENVNVSEENQGRILQEVLLSQITRLIQDVELENASVRSKSICCSTRCTIILTCALISFLLIITLPLSIPAIEKAL